MKTIVALAAALAAAATHAWAQDVAPGKDPASSLPPAACCVVAAGTPVVLELTEELSSRTARRGAPFPLRLAEPIEVGGHVLIPVGTVGQGEVIDAQKSGMGGKPGELMVAARYLDVGDVRVPLRGFKVGAHGEAGGHGVNKTKEAQTVILLVSPLFGYVGIHGGEMVMAAGARGDAKIAADVTLPATAAPPPASATQEGKTTTQ